jgi:2-(1,2-epoxy-1,2-dihydrophenyl)acetyl-CoA isomerase
LDSPYRNLRFELEDGTACITLDRPAAHNAIDLATCEELMAAAIRCDEDAAIRAVVLTGAGSAFSVGGDIQSFVAAGDRLAELTKRMTVGLHAAVSRFARMDAPLIAAVNGVAAGGGLGLVCCADLAIAAESARFASAYTKSGLSPDTSTTFFLPRLIGWRRAQELILTNRTLGAAEACEWGIVTRVVPDAELGRIVRELASQLADGATRAYGASKRLLLASASETLETQMEHEAREIADRARGEDVGEGIRAFLEKRTPRFQGR